MLWLSIHVALYFQFYKMILHTRYYLCLWHHQHSSLVLAMATSGPHFLSVVTKNKNDWLNEGEECSYKIFSTTQSFGHFHLATSSSSTCQFSHRPYRWNNDDERSYDGPFSFCLSRWSRSYCKSSSSSYRRFRDSKQKHSLLLGGHGNHVFFQFFCWHTYSSTDGRVGVNPLCIGPRWKLCTWSSIIFCRKAVGTTAMPNLNLTVRGRLKPCRLCRPNASFLRTNQMQSFQSRKYIATNWIIVGFMIR